MWRVVLVLTLIGSLLPERSDACSFLLSTHAIDEAEQKLDTQRPDRVVGEVGRVTRGRGSRTLPDGLVTVSSCDDIGVIEVVLTHFRDDRTPVEKLGYRVALVDGTPPAGLRIEDSVLLTFVESQTAPSSDRRFNLIWIDGAGDDQEPFDFTFVVTAVDLAGHESVASAPIRAQHQGTTTR
jgi:hypothetical protein